MSHDKNSGGLHVLGHLGSFVLQGFVDCSRQRSHFKNGGAVDERLPAGSRLLQRNCYGCHDISSDHHSPGSVTSVSGRVAGPFPVSS